MNYFEKPAANEHTEYFGHYIGLVAENNLIDALISGMNQTLDFLKALPAGKWPHRYAEGKWDIHEILGHIIDSERVFMYRSLCFARGETQSLPGFDEEIFARHSNAAGRKPEDLMQEYADQRKSTISMFSGFDPECLVRSGTANEKQNSVRAIGYVIAGHEIHHMNVIRERYL